MRICCVEKLARAVSRVAASRVRSLFVVNTQLGAVCGFWLFDGSGSDTVFLSPSDKTTSTGRESETGPSLNTLSMRESEQPISLMLEASRQLSVSWRMVPSLAPMWILVATVLRALPVRTRGCALHPAPPC